MTRKSPRKVTQEQIMKLGMVAAMENVQGSELTFPEWLDWCSKELGVEPESLPDVAVRRWAKLCGVKLKAPEVSPYSMRYRTNGLFQVVDALIRDLGIPIDPSWQHLVDNPSGVKTEKTIEACKKQVQAIHDAAKTKKVVGIHGS